MDRTCTVDKRYIKKLIKKCRHVNFVFFALTDHYCSVDRGWPNTHFILFTVFSCASSSVVGIPNSFPLPGGRDGRWPRLDDQLKVRQALFRLPFLGPSPCEASSAVLMKKRVHSWSSNLPPKTVVKITNNGHGVVNNLQMEENIPGKRRIGSTKFIRRTLKYIHKRTAELYDKGSILPNKCKQPYH